MTHNQMNDSEYDVIVRSLDRIEEPFWFDGPEFPVPPQSVMDFSALARKPNVRISELSRIVEMDSGLTIELLRRANSSAHGLRQKVNSVPRAIALLGISNCVSVFLTKALSRALKQVDSELISNADARRESLERARFASEVARRLGHNPFLSYTAAMLQDILLPLLTRRHFDEYSGYLKHESYPNISQFEKETFGWTHAELTAKALLKWGFPESLVVRVLLHHNYPEEFFLTGSDIHVATSNAVAGLLTDVLRQSPGGILRLAELQDYHPVLNVLEIAEAVDEESASADQQICEGLSLTSRIQYELMSQIDQRRRSAIVPGRQFGNYVLEEKITESAMGAIFKATHVRLRQPTAIKFLRVDRMTGESIRQFEKEVQVTSTLRHPNTISIFDFGRTLDDLFYYAMDFIEGLTLEQLVSECDPLPDGRVLQILMQVCGSLAEAHSRQLIHRDIKPQNIMVSASAGMGDRVTVLDFGLVEECHNSTQQQRSLTGTPHYMSPEAAACRSEMDGRSDLYSLAAVGYFLLTGRPVFQGTITDVLHGHIEKTPLPMTSVGTQTIEADLELLIMECLSKNPNDRPNSAIEMMDRLGQISPKNPWTAQEALNWWQSRTERDGNLAVKTLADVNADTVIAASF